MTEFEAIIWGPYRMPRSRASAHFLASGTTGSGKTTLIDILMRSVFSAHRGKNHRALIYDAKQEALSKLKALGVGDRIRILHPFDARCSPWDLATDIDDPLSARQFAQILIPDSSLRQDDSGFFEEACRDIIAVTVQVFSLCVPQKEWTLRDLLLSLLYPENLEAILALRQTRSGKPFLPSRRVWSSYFDLATTDDRTRGNIRSTLNAKLSVFEPVAAAWTFAKAAPFSLKKWQENNGNEILILGNDESARAAIDPINRALFQRAAELTLARPEGQSTQTWFFLDEVREAGRLQALNPLLLKGRSKGACVVLSFQDIEGLRDVYGPHLANELVANCNNVALLRTSSAATAEWAAQMFGKFFVTDSDKTRGLSGTEISSSVTERLGERQAVLSGELLYLPLPSEKTGLVGYFRDSAAKADEPKRYTLDLSGQLYFGTGTNSEPMAREELFLEPWTKHDWERLGLDGEPPDPSHPNSDSDREPPRRPQN